MLDKSKAWIVENPSRRAWTTSALTILTSVLVAALVRTIAQGSAIIWTDAWRSPYLYGLLLVYCLFGSFQSAALRFDKRVSRNISMNNPYKYVERECLPDYASHCKKLLAEGKLHEYHDAQDRLRGKDRVR